MNLWLILQCDFLSAVNLFEGVSEFRQSSLYVWRNQGVHTRCLQPTSCCIYCDTLIESIGIALMYRAYSEDRLCRLIQTHPSLLLGLTSENLQSAHDIGLVPEHSMACDFHPQAIEEGQRLNALRDAGFDVHALLSPEFHRDVSYGILFAVVLLTVCAGAPSPPEVASLQNAGHRHSNTQSCKRDRAIISCQPESYNGYDSRLGG